MSKEKNVLNDEYTSRSIRYPLLVNEMENLLGQVLTIIDASIAEPRQNKAMKDLLKQRFGDKLHGTFWDYCYRKEYEFHDPFVRTNVIDGVGNHSTDMAIGPLPNPPLPLEAE